MLIDRLEKAEERFAKAMDVVLHDERVLTVLGGLARLHFSQVAAAPAAASFPRVSIEREELFMRLRAAWAAAAAVMGAGELAERLRVAAPPDFSPTPSEIVCETADFRLRRVGARGEGEPLLIVASLINRWYVLDLLAGNSLLEALEPLGRPVYVLEWREPRARDPRPLEELVSPVCQAIDACGGRAALAGYSMGGTLATITAARRPKRVSRLATIASPVRFSGAGAFARWLAPRHLDVERVLAAYDPVPAWLVHLPFWGLRPTIKLKKLLALQRDFGRPGALDRFLASEVWNHDSVDVGAGVFRTWVGDLYQRDALATGELGVELRTLRCPVLTVAADGDDITPAPSAEALLELSRSRAPRSLRLPGGHVGLVSSRRALSALVPAIGRWLEE
jgi:polyhydroxyalkanoate synthase